jgi:hypothetical protein
MNNPISGNSTGDLVYAYNKTSKRIEDCFKLGSESTNHSPVWRDELRLSPPKTIYKYRWNVDTYYDRISVWCMHTYTTTTSCHLNRLLEYS